jgi:predicted DNA-binding transcriptional regulator AlpA
MPDLRALLDDPAGIAALSAEEAAAALVELSALQTALAARLRACSAVPKPHGPAAQADRLLTPEQVAERFGRSRDWVYRKSRTVAWRPFTMREGRKTLRFSEAGLRHYFATKKVLTS